MRIKHIITIVLWDEIDLPPAGSTSDEADASAVGDKIYQARIQTHDRFARFVESDEATLSTETKEAEE